jgi:hypothetical protein
LDKENTIMNTTYIDLETMTYFIPIASYMVVLLIIVHYIPNV